MAKRKQNDTGSSHFWLELYLQFLSDSTSLHGPVPPPKPFSSCRLLISVLVHSCPIQLRWLPCYSSNIGIYQASSCLRAFALASSTLENVPSDYLDDLFFNLLWTLFKLHLSKEALSDHPAEIVPHPLPLLYSLSPFPDLFFSIAFVTM